MVNRSHSAMLQKRASFADFWIMGEANGKFKVKIPTVEEIVRDLECMRNAIFDDQSLTEEERLAR